MRVHKQNTPTSPAIAQCNNNIERIRNTDTGNVSSNNSGIWSLEQVMDHYIYSNSCTDSGLLHMKDAAQPLKTGLPNANTILADANAAILKPNRSTSETFSAVDANGAVGRPVTGAVSRFENGGTLMSHMRTYGVEMGRNPRVYHLYQENCLNFDAFVPGKKFDYAVSLLEPQIRNYSDGDHRLQRQRYLHGATHTPILFSGDIRSNEHLEGTQLSLQERAAHPEIFYDHTHGAFNRLEIGRAIRGATVGLNTIPTTGSIKTGFVLPWNQNFVTHKFSQDSKYDGNLKLVCGTGGTNVWAGGNQALSFGKCMPNMKGCPAVDNVAANMFNATSWNEKRNNTDRLESLPNSGSGNAVFTNSNKRDKSVASFEGKHEILPKSDVGGILPARFHRSGVFYRNAAVGIQHHSSNFNRAPGSQVCSGGRYIGVSQPRKVLESPPFMNSL